MEKPRKKKLMMHEQIAWAKPQRNKISMNTLMQTRYLIQEQYWEPRNALRLIETKLLSKRDQTWRITLKCSLGRGWVTSGKSASTKFRCKKLQSNPGDVNSWRNFFRPEALCVLTSFPQHARPETIKIVKMCLVRSLILGDS